MKRQRLEPHCLHASGYSHPADLGPRPGGVGIVHVACRSEGAHLVWEGLPGGLAWANAEECAAGRHRWKPQVVTLLRVLGLSLGWTWAVCARGCGARAGWSPKGRANTPAARGWGAVSTGRYSGDSKVPGTFLPHPEPAPSPCANPSCQLCKALGAQ